MIQFQELGLKIIWNPFDVTKFLEWINSMIPDKSIRVIIVSLV
jgi:hypothetical protein